MKPIMMRRWSVLFVCVLLAAVLTGCGTGGGGPTEPSTPAETTVPVGTTVPTEATVPTDVFTRALPAEGHTDNNTFILEARSFILDEWRYVHLDNRWEDGRFVLTGMQQVPGTEQATADTNVWMFQIDFDVYLDDTVESCRYYTFIWENDFRTDDKLYGRDSYESFGEYDPSFIDHFDRADYLAEYGNPYAASVYAAAEAYGEVTSEGKQILMTAVEDLLASGGSCAFSEMEGRYPIAETNQYLDDVVECWSWIEVDPSEPLPDCFYVEYLPESGGRIRFYDVDYGIVELESGGEIRRWAASSVYRYYNEDLFRTAYDLAFKYCDYSIYTTPLTCEADNYEEACRIIATELLPGRHTAMSEHSAFYALEYEVLEYEIGPQLGEDGTWADCWVSYAIRQPELDLGSYGNVGEGTGEWEGWLMLNHWGFRVVSNGDGTWHVE